MSLVITALAGGLGAAARFIVDTFVGRAAQRTKHLRRARIPLGTVVVNTSACLLIGLLTGFAAALPGSAGPVPVVGVGLLGGYSTFSTASVEGARLVLDGRLGAAVAHAGGMLGLGLLAGVAGLAAGAALAG